MVLKESVLSKEETKGQRDYYRSRFKFPYITEVKSGKTRTTAYVSQLQIEWFFHSVSSQMVSWMKEHLLCAGNG